MSSFKTAWGSPHSPPPRRAHGAPRPRRADGRRGYALAVVLVFITLALSFWGLSQRATLQALRAEKLHRLRFACDQGAGQAVLDGLHRLETEVPASPTSYPFSTLVEGAERHYLVTLTLVETQGQRRVWTVSALPQP